MIRALIARQFNLLSSRFQGFTQRAQQGQHQQYRQWERLQFQARGALRALSFRALKEPARLSTPASLSALSLSPLPLFAGSAAASTLVPGVLEVHEMGLLGWFLVDLAINVAGWAVAAIQKTEMFYDLVGSVSFATLTAGSLLMPGPLTARKVLVSTMVGVWTARLGSFLVQRVHKVGEDSRFREVKHQPGMFLVYWTMQAIWVFTTLLPVLVVNGARASAPLGLLDLAGFVVYATGLSIEAIADGQKNAFRANPANKGGFIKEGLWAYSRHPNYFGEMVLWCGVWLTCASSFTQPWHVVTLASPLFVIYLISNVSGVPILEAAADKRWGGQPDYEAYKAATSVLIPLPPKKNES